MSKELRLLADPDLCTGCMRCAYACSARHEGAFAPSLSRIQISAYPLAGYSVPGVCYHCAKPFCGAACPESAISKADDGTVLVDDSLCTGCGECLAACPWGMIQARPDTGKAFKCDLCGGDPACVAQCQPKALLFVQPDKEQTMARAKRMKNRADTGSPEEKRYACASALLEEAGR